MNVTFLFGNGFDRRMGLQTSYQDIIAHYASIHADDEKLMSFKKDLTDKSEYWSDFEMGLGKYTEEYDCDKQEDFIAALNDFVHEMMLYLQREEDNINYSLFEEIIRDEFSRSIQTFDGELSRLYRNQIKEIIDSTVSEINEENEVFKKQQELAELNEQKKYEEA